MTCATLKQSDPIKTNAPRVDLALIKVLEENNRSELSEMIKARSEIGLKAYGDHLRIFNGRCAKTDLIQELLDAMMYAMQDRMESERDCDYIIPVLVEMCETLRVKMGNRDE